MITPTQTINGRYRIERQIGRGGMATVHLAWDERLNRYVALKMLSDACAEDAAFVERFKREARAMASFSHANIVAVYDWGQSDDGYFMVMEYIAGQTLRQMLLERGPLPESEVRAIGAQIAAALSEAHQRGIVHRDIKPHNILVSAEGRVKVADFGIARVAGDSPLTITQAIMGTVQYLAPEQVLRDPVDARADLYSLGIVLYELLTGAAPFNGDSIASVALQHVQAPLPPLRARRPGISPDMEAIVQRATEKDPAQRFPTADALATALMPVPGVSRRVARGTGARLLINPRSSRSPAPASSIHATTPRTTRRAAPHPAWLATVPLVLLLSLILHGTNALTAPTLASPVVRTEGVTGGARTVASATTASVPVAMANMPSGIFSTLDESVSASKSIIPSAATTVLAPTVTAPATVAAPTATTAPPPTQAPTAAPPTAPPPTMVPPTVSAPRIVARAARPQDAVLGFYQLVMAHQFDVAAALWSPQLQAQQPPAQAINARYAQTDRIIVQHWEVTAQTAEHATVTVSVSEYTQGTTTPKNSKSVWQLVHTDAGWLLDTQEAQS